MRLEGTISVKMALESDWRTVEVIYMDEKKKSKDFGYILQVAKNKNVPVQRISRTQLDDMCEGSTHGGVCCDVSQRMYQTLAELPSDKPLFLALIEGIEDPFNFGYALRTLYAAGCDGCLVPARNWSEEAGIVAKSSAGALDKLPLIVYEDANTLLTELKNRGVTIYCAMREDAIGLYEADFTESCLIAIGGPKRGLSSSVLQNSDRNIYIPYARNFRNALNAGSAIAVISYEIYRQRTQTVIK
ncbi:MAG: RNA methyltransferase [Erysipelotrichaceae bacterium]|nr:RNA methyltransferase [Erysipelotrichaceae bacterium]